MSYVTSISKVLKFDVEEDSRVKTYNRFYALFRSQAYNKGYGDILKLRETPGFAMPKASDPDTTTDQAKKRNTTTACARTMIS